MRPSVLIVEDSPSTADLAKMALAHIQCEVAVAPDAPRALELLSGFLSPCVMVIDAYLPGVQPRPFVVSLHDAAPDAAMVLLFERGTEMPLLPEVSARLYKPLQPRRFASLVTELLDDYESDPGAAG